MKKINVAIIDDNKEFCEILEQYLLSEGCFNVVGKAHDGLEGFDLIKNETPDLVVLDVVMPKADGIDVLEMLNSADIMDKTKVIMLSALGRENIIQKAMHLGAEYYMVKPFEFDVFSRRVKSLFDVETNVQPKKRSDSSNMILFNPDPEGVDTQITNMMHKIGVPAHVRGYMYVRKAIKMVLDDISLLNAVTKELYPNLAREFNTTPSRVERAIRHAIELAWARGDKEAMMEICGPVALEGKPTNSNFIASVSEKIRMSNKK